MNQNFTVLARKWRPKQFSDLIGQEVAITIIKNTIALKRLHHAYLLTGTRGVGKTTIARIIAKAINCLNLSIDVEPCNQCSSCLQISEGRFVDLIEVDAASNTGIDNMRELIESSQYAPTQGSYKVFIIDEVHMLSKAAFNAMLKTLEEPPSHVIFILATTEVHKIPVTITSRCLQLKLKNLHEHEIINRLTYILQQENINFEAEALQLVAKAAKGSMRDALSLLDPAIAYGNNIISEELVRTMLGISSEEIILEILEHLSSFNANKLLELAHEIKRQGLDYEEIISTLSEKFMNITIAQLTGVSKLDSNLQQFLTKFAINDLQLYFEICNLCIEHLNNASDKFPIFIMALMRMLAFRLGTSKEQESTLIASNSTINQNEPNNILVTIAQPTLEQNNSEEDFISRPLLEKIKAEAEQQVELESVSEPILTLKENFNWHEFVVNIKNSTPTLYPILENSELLQYSNSSLTIAINETYESAFRALEIVFNETLSKYFGQSVSFNIQFKRGLDNTLKSKLETKKRENQLKAEQSILNDENLNKILNQFSAIIMPNSIKPL